jgi:hypothetical protein
MNEIVGRAMDCFLNPSSTSVQHNLTVNKVEGDLSLIRAGSSEQLWTNLGPAYVRH